MKTRILFLVAGASLMQAQRMDLRLGLWEVTTKTETTGMPAMPTMDTSKMPPEARARMEAIMKARQAKGPQTRTNQNCVTKEDLEKGAFQGDNDRATCKRTVISSTLTSQDVKIECTGKQKMTGEAKFTALSRDSVNGTLKITMGDGPNPMTINSNITAKWLGAACGDVK